MSFGLFVTGTWDNAFAVPKWNGKGTGRRRNSTATTAAAAEIARPPPPPYRNGTTTAQAAAELKRTAQRPPPPPPYRKERQRHRPPPYRKERHNGQRNGRRTDTAATCGNGTSAAHNVCNVCAARVTVAWDAYNGKASFG
nr:MAG TPA: hypothetical protein [Bacteriophage sp.]